MNFFNNAESSKDLVLGLICVLIASLISCFAIAGAIGFPKYIYYLNLRWVVTIQSLINFFYLVSKSSTDQFHRKSFIVLALVFNPLMPLHLSRMVWVILDIMAAYLLYKTSLQFYFKMLTGKEFR